MIVLFYAVCRFAEPSASDERRVVTSAYAVVRSSGDAAATAQYFP
jgi:hypothetical protein